MAEKALRVLVLTPDYEVFESLYARFAPKEGEDIQVVAWVQEGERLRQEVKNCGADVVLLDPRAKGWSEDDLFDLYHHPEKAVVAVGLCPPHGDWPRRLEAMGVREFFTLPLDEAALRRLPAACHRAVGEAFRERASPDYVARLAPEAAAKLAARGVTKGVYAVAGNKGGVGKTLVAKEVWGALGLGGFSVVLVDLNMAGGRVSLDLGFDPQDPDLPNLFGLLNAWLAKRMHPSDEILSRHLVRYGGRRFNLWFLPGIPKQHMADDRGFLEHGEEFVRWLLRALKRSFDFVIVDTGQDLNRTPHLVALEEADRIFLVVEQDMDSLWGTGEVLSDLRRMGIDSTRFFLVVNKYHPAHGIDKGRVASILGIPVGATISLEVTYEGGSLITRAKNSGELLVLTTRSQVAQDIVNYVAGSICPPVRDVWFASRRLPGVRGRSLLRELLDWLGL